MRSLVRFGAVLCLFFTFAMPVPAFAQTDVLADPCSDPVVSKDSPTCQSRTKVNPLKGTDGTLYKISMIMAVVSGVAAVIMIIVSGFKYITSGGDTQKTAAAKQTLIGAVVGLVIIVLAQTIITFVVNRIN